ncbi:HAD family phosphatase [Microbacterium sp. K24]|uniref:HAD family hydrolase n=1 Tax=Microbacterium sp. K24 TaxID=2305446 RepID=UPI00109D2F1B|nr:HAD family phosphatase [Microbacterium sp. K24]
MPSIRAVLFDLDGVIRHFDSEHTTEIERRYGFDPGTITAVAFEPDVLEQVTTGVISRRAWVDRVGETLGSAEAAEEWGRQPSDLDAQVLAVADDLRAAGIRTAILTNGTDTIAAEAEELGLHHRFEAIFNSAEIGWAKPDARAFQHVLDALGLAASEVFFTDDSAGKLAGAEELGMPTHHFTSVDGLRGALRDAGIDF